MCDLTVVADRAIDHLVRMYIHMAPEAIKVMFGTDEFVTPDGGTGTSLRIEEQLGCGTVIGVKIGGQLTSGVEYLPPAADHFTLRPGIVTEIRMVLCMFIRAFAQLLIYFMTLI